MTDLSRRWGPQRNQLLSSLGALAQCHKEDRTLALRMGGEKLRHIIVIERQARRPQALRVSCQIQLAPQDSCLELDSAITSIAETLENRSQIRQKKHCYAGLSREFLFETEVVSFRAKTTSF